MTKFLKKKMHFFVIFIIIYTIFCRISMFWYENRHHF